ncbi:hypothetical protein ADT25_07235 [Xanthomonas oryzae]|uniref:Uncharacterized protein n=1 Tax=Xanthomonas oryzae TaxID=347 RepID=A0AAP0ZNP4_9XANT|nr:hypothetical protein ADT25_07235 [Xanthomonas oryzae]QBG83114.1 hypothetical protein EYR27_02985 [Xanthomonas oryzae]
MSSSDGATPQFRHDPGPFNTCMRDAASLLELSERVLMTCVFAALHIDVIRQVVRDIAAQLIAHLKRSFDGGIAHRLATGRHWSRWRRCLPRCSRSGQHWAWSNLGRCAGAMTQSQDLEALLASWRRAFPHGLHRAARCIRCMHHCTHA